MVLEDGRVRSEACTCELCLDMECYATWQVIGKILENIYNKIGYIIYR